MKFTTYANDALRSFPASHFDTLQAALDYGTKTGKLFSVAGKSGIILATKRFDDSEVVIYDGKGGGQ